ncbi:hypothetical protein BASA50_000955 [Batrachochytrium salamandrivorans]|uniref:Uncharacterized protein n=1 Tax=Batrachochytrium salamandrivorans TaxID=1357716 RepID=A0ABQ8ETC1_9FUNG|nr:hypothetical protein BASA50_000955 [Batrachochytrium salamandrivorans]KAH9249294.1 hypothetical protein BASA81_012967 [Batrachochytrium salamandrivorans]KAH9275692.1 hypothetical protein BASA83_001992 [Batrachochytrium salamandrivorans]
MVSSPSRLLAAASSSSSSASNAVQTASKATAKATRAAKASAQAAGSAGSAAFTKGSTHQSTHQSTQDSTQGSTQGSTHESTQGSTQGSTHTVGQTKQEDNNTNTTIDNDTTASSALLSLTSQPALSLDQHRSRILNETKNVSSFVVIGQTLHRLYYVDKLVKNQREFLEWTKRNLGFSKSTTYEYIISYKIYSEIASKLPSAYRPPAYQSHCQLLSKVPDDTLVDTWIAVCHAAPNGTITTAFLESFLESNHHLKHSRSTRNDDDHLKRSQSGQSSHSVDEPLTPLAPSQSIATNNSMTSRHGHCKPDPSDLIDPPAGLQRQPDDSSSDSPSQQQSLFLESQSQLHVPRSLKKARSTASANAGSSTLHTSAGSIGSTPNPSTRSTRHSQSALTQSSGSSHPPSVSKRKRSLAAATAVTSVTASTGADEGDDAVITNTTTTIDGLASVVAATTEAPSSMAIDSQSHTPSDLIHIPESVPSFSTPRGRRRFDETAAIAIAAAAATAAAAGRASSSIKISDSHSIDLQSPAKGYSPSSASELHTPSRKRSRASRSVPSQASPVKTPLALKLSPTHSTSPPTLRHPTMPSGSAVSSTRGLRRTPRPVCPSTSSLEPASSVFQSPARPSSQHHQPLLREEDLSDDLQSNMLSRHIYSPSHVFPLSSFIQENYKSPYALCTTHSGGDGGGTDYDGSQAGIQPPHSNSYHDDQDPATMGPLRDINMLQLPFSDSHLPFQQSTIFELGKEIVLGQHFDIIANSSEEFALIRQQGWFGRVWCDLSSSRPFSTSSLGTLGPQAEYTGLERQLQIIFTKFDCNEFVEGLFLIRGEFGADWFTPILQTPYCILRHVTLPCLRRPEPQVYVKECPSLSLGSGGAGPSPESESPNDAVLSSSDVEGLNTTHTTTTDTNTIGTTTATTTTPSVAAADADTLVEALPAPTATAAATSASKLAHPSSFDSYVVFYLGPNVKDFCIKFSSVGLVSGINSWSAVMSTSQLLKPTSISQLAPNANASVISDSLVAAVIHNAIQESTLDPRRQQQAGLFNGMYTTAGDAVSDYEGMKAETILPSGHRSVAREPHASEVKGPSIALHRQRADVLNGSVNEAASALCGIGRLGA